MIAAGANLASQTFTARDRANPERGGFRRSLSSRRKMSFEFRNLCKTATVFLTERVLNGQKRIDASDGAV
jgi:hypothetical protein